MSIQANAAPVEGRLRIPTGRETRFTPFELSSQGIGRLTSAKPERCPSIDIRPADAVRRHAAVWRGISGEVVQILTDELFETGFQAPVHLLIAYERARRRDGETVVEGLASSTLRQFSDKLTFVPAGHHFSEWQVPCVTTRATFLFIDPREIQFHPDLAVRCPDFRPRLFFSNSILFETARKLGALIEAGNSTDDLYAEALGTVLFHELVRLDPTAMQVNRPQYGGLAGWQRKRVSEYIEENLSQNVSLAELSALARLSRWHFARAFKQTFGVPPHRYHAGRRVERAKLLLADRNRTITEVAFLLGFQESSSFTSMFHKVTGQTPRLYRRSII
jgi:AraC-like DNA-binding protein